MTEHACCTAKAHTRARQDKRAHMHHWREHVAANGPHFSAPTRFVVGRAPLQVAANARPSPTCGRFRPTFQVGSFQLLMHVPPDPPTCQVATRPSSRPTRTSGGASAAKPRTCSRTTTSQSSGAAMGALDSCWVPTNACGRTHAPGDTHMLTAAAGI
eukprot:355556-Chlamydomonas_euryale.AAC.3